MKIIVSIALALTSSVCSFFQDNVEQESLGQQQAQELSLIEQTQEQSVHAPAELIISFLPFEVLSKVNIQ